MKDNHIKGVSENVLDLSRATRKLFFTQDFTRKLCKLSKKMMINDDLANLSLNII